MVERSVKKTEELSKRTIQSNTDPDRSFHNVIVKNGTTTPPSPAIFHHKRRAAGRI